MARLAGVLIIATLVAGAGAGPAGAATFQVDTVQDDPTFTACDPVTPDDCSLRGAIAGSNATPAVDDTIGFAIPGAGPHTIVLNGALPDVTDTVTIDGYSQAGASANTQAAPTNAFSIDGGGSNAVLKVELDLNDHPGLVVSAGGSVIRGLAIYNLREPLDPPGPPFGDFVFSYGIELRTIGGNEVEGNFIGLTAAGTAPADFEDLNKQPGVGIVSGDGNTIGGLVPAARNVISANGGGNWAAGVQVVGGANTKIQGNLIGTTPDGTDIPTVPDPFGGGPVDVYNGTRGGIDVNDNFPVGDPITNLVIGGTEDHAGNVVSGNSHHAGAVNVVAPWTTPEAHVLGNRIGTDVAGTAALGNASLSGVETLAPIAIGDDAGHGNLISGNGNGAMVRGSGGTVEGNRIGTSRSGLADLGNSGIGVILEGDEWQIGGTTPGARNVISGNGSYGVGTIFSNGNMTLNAIEGNYIGTDLTGTAAIPNDQAGIALAGPVENTIGGAALGAGNVIAGNGGPGVQLHLPEGTVNDENEILGNRIGVDAAGGLLGNAGPGVRLYSGRGNVVGRPGEGNVIAGNEGDGIVVTGDEFEFGDERSDNDGNSIRGNSIFDNEALGIDLSPDDSAVDSHGDGVSPNDDGDPDDGGNDRQNFPVLYGALPGSSTALTGTLSSSPSTTFTLDFYEETACDPSHHGEGRTHLGSAQVRTDANGNAVWSHTVSATVPTDRHVTATATAPDGSTSEFSRCRRSGTSDPLPGTAVVAQETTEQTTTGTTGQTQQSGESCRDRRPPITTMRRSNVRLTRRGAKIVLTGRSADHRDCPSGVQRIDVSLARVAGRTGVNCRFVKRRNRYSLTGRKNCRRPTLFRATGTGRWTFTFDVKLRPGLYRAQARGTDRARNKETPNKRRNIVFFSVR